MRRHLIFLPGAGGDPNFWRPLGDLLPRDWRKTYLAWPGLGTQPPDARVTGFDDLVRLTLAAIDDEPADLLAQSMGGVVAMRIALDHPQRVRRLVLAATSGGIDTAALGGSDWRPEYRAAFPHAASWITDVRVDLSTELSSVLHPTLLLWGDTDPISPVSVGRRLQSLLRNSSLQAVPGADHGFVQEKPGEIAAAILRHLQ